MATSSVINVLQLAALNGFKELAQLLLESGADPLVRSEVGGV